MQAKSIKRFWPFRNGSDSAVLRDADQLMAIHGAHAHETAGLYSWREDIGLLFTHQPGHWHRVRLEIGRRTGKDAKPASRTTCNIQALHLM